MHLLTLGSRMGPHVSCEGRRGAQPAGWLFAKALNCAICKKHLPAITHQAGKPSPATHPLQGKARADLREKQGKTRHQHRRPGCYSLT